MSTAALGSCVYLLVGQRGAGKSFYAKRLIEAQPELKLFSRDELLVRLYGSTELSPYTGVHQYVQGLLLRHVHGALREQPEAKLLLDCWTGDSHERRLLLSALRRGGTTRVVALYFMTPLEAVNRWFWEKPGIAKSEEWGQQKKGVRAYYPSDTPQRDYELFHQWARGIDAEGFNAVVRVNPLDDVIVLP